MRWERCVKPGSELAVERSEVLRYLGYRGQELDGELDERIRIITEKCVTELEPRYVWEVFDLRETQNGPVLCGPELAPEGEDIKRHLHGAVKCAVMAATLGFEAERALMRLGQRSTTDETIYNAACTALIESAGDECEREIIGFARSMGLQTSYRYSPGYGDFPLECQRQVLDAVDAGGRLGITLTDSFLMLPRKSVSALIGLYPEAAGVRRGGTTCETCENYVNCEFRKEGFGCGG